MKKILLTGASGFVGSHFLRHALGQGFHVIALTRYLRDEYFHANLEWRVADLTIEQNWGQLLESVDVVVNIAAEITNEILIQSVNYDGPLRLFNASIDAGVRRWVQLSSVGTYGPVQKGVVVEDRDDRPESRYEKSKSDFDIMLIEASKFSSIEVSIVRPSNVYGLGMRNRSIEQLLGVISKNLFAFVGPVNASANYVHVQDVVQALDLCVSHPNAANQIYIVSAWATIETMICGLAAGAGVNPPFRRVSFTVACWLANVMQNWSYWPLTLGRIHAMSARCSYSTGKIEKELGWKLTVSVEDGMRQLAADLRQ